MEHAEHTWAVRRCREALPKGGKGGSPVAYHVPEAEAQGDLLWRSLEDMERADVLAIMDRLEAAEADHARRAWTPRVDELAEGGR